MKDTRSWKCFFGLHQWEAHEKISTKHFRDGELTLPYKISTRIRMKCVHCGKWKSFFID